MNVSVILAGFRAEDKLKTRSSEFGLVYTNAMIDTKIKKHPLHSHIQLNRNVVRRSHIQWNTLLGSDSVHSLMRVTLSSSLNCTTRLL
jgi:hypothetical protein